MVQRCAGNCKLYFCFSVHFLFILHIGFFCFVIFERDFCDLFSLLSNKISWHFLFVDFFCTISPLACMCICVCVCAPFVVIGRFGMHFFSFTFSALTLQSRRSVSAAGRCYRSARFSCSVLPSPLLQQCAPKEFATRSRRASHR